MPFDTTTLLDRFLRYVRIDTQADERSTTYPSTPGQLELGRLLKDELLAMGIQDARQTEFGIVIASIPSTLPANVPSVPVVAFNAHVDTSPETSGKNVKPIVHKNYNGKDIVLPGDTSKVIKTSDNPDLAKLIGKTIVTTDGSTLLGSDDKSGVAVIMEAARILAADKSIPHGKIVICFTCDEEIGKGTKHLEPSDLGADVAYTLDGSGVGEIDTETFSADKATITITGINIHPSIAKSRMLNAIKVAAAFIDKLPKGSLSPETTCDREPYLHPYIIEGGVGKTVIHCLLRSFDTPELTKLADQLKSIGRDVERDFPEAQIEVAVNQQYRNMKDGIAKEPRAIPFAVEAMKRLGITAKQNSIRGGTDGALLTAKGLPTPNLSTGEHNFHSPLEWTCLEEMETAVNVVIELAKVWAGK
jgi:tripeptide aminopeptidase